MQIILASTSPRRQELLKVAGIDFSVMPVAIDESEQVGENPNDYLYRMVEGKADHAYQTLLSSTQTAGNILINWV